MKVWQPCVCIAWHSALSVPWLQCTITKMIINKVKIKVVWDTCQYMWIKLHYNQNTITLWFLHCTIFDQIKFWILMNKMKKYKSSTSILKFWSMTVVNALNYCTTLLGNSYGKKKDCKIIHDFIVYSIESLCTSQYGGAPYHLNYLSLVLLNN